VYAERDWTSAIAIGWFVTHLNVGVQKVVARNGRRVQAAGGSEGGTRNAGGAEERGHGVDDQ